MKRAAGESHHLREVRCRQIVLCPWAGGKEGVSTSTQGCKWGAEAVGLYIGCVPHQTQHSLPVMGLRKGTG